MTLSLRPVEKKHLRSLFDLRVHPEQNDFVAPNEITLAQQAYEPGGSVWGLWDDETPVGLIAMIHIAKSDEIEEDDDLGAAYIWRLMIGKDHQSKGYGREAIDLAANVAREWGLPRLCLTFVDEPGGAEPFYIKNGFKRTGRVISDEVEMVRDV